MTSLDDLPNDIFIEHILPQLYPCSRFAQFGPVSRRFYKLAYLTPIKVLNFCKERFLKKPWYDLTYRKLSIQKLLNKDWIDRSAYLKTVVSEFLDRFSFVNKQNFARVEGLYLGTTSLPVLEELSKRFTNVRKIKACVDLSFRKFISDTDCAHALMKFPKLQHLDLELCNGLNIHLPKRGLKTLSIHAKRPYLRPLPILPKEIFLIPSEMKDLESLSSNLWFFGSSLSSITEMNLDMSSFVVDEFLPNSELPSLSKFSLKYAGRNFPNLSKFHKTLKHLKITDPTRGNLRGDATCYEGLQLETLELVNVHEEFLSTISRSTWYGLNSLILIGSCFKSKNDGLKELLPFMVSLKIFESSYRTLDFRGFVRLLSASSLNLTSLSLDNLYSSTSSEMMMLMAFLKSTPLEYLRLDSAIIDKDIMESIGKLTNLRNLSLNLQCGSVSYIDFDQLLLPLASLTKLQALRLRVSCSYSRKIDSTALWMTLRNMKALYRLVLDRWIITASDFRLVTQTLGITQSTYLV